MKTYYFPVSTFKRTNLIDITNKVKDTVNGAGVYDGICLVYSPHTTAAVIINEAADPNVASDIESFLNELVPLNRGFKHLEGNSDSHIKSALIGNSRIIPIIDGRLSLGTWEGIFLCEFDGPRERRVIVKII